MKKTKITTRHPPLIVDHALTLILSLVTFAYHTLLFPPTA